MANNFEYKVVCWNKVPRYIASRQKGYGFAFADGKEQEVLAFAGRAVQLLSERHSSAILDGLVRVDIFTTATNDMVVNEFESLEAMFLSKNSTWNNFIQTNMRRYWFDILNMNIRKCLAVQDCNI